MKRILFITTSFEVGAIPNILLDLAPYWRSAGWDCCFLALEPLPEDHASVKRCRELGFPLQSLNVGSRSVFRALFRLRKKIRELAPDLISTHLGRADIYTPWVKGSLPLLTTHHNVKRNAGRFTLWGYQISDDRVALRTGVSQACNDSFVVDGFLKSPHVMISNPLDPSRLVVTKTRDQLLESWGWTEPVRLLIAVARLTPAKGLNHLIDALGVLVREGQHDLRLVFAGEGPLRRDLEAQVAQLHLTPYVRFLGRSESVANLYSAAEGLVLPSLWEGLGLVILEAWSLGCPVAASRLPAVCEIVQDGVNGYLFEPGSSTACLEGIRQLLADPQRSSRLAQKGKSLVLERFSPQVIAEQYAQVFASLTPPRL